MKMSGDCICQKMQLDTAEQNVLFKQERRLRDDAREYDTQTYCVMSSACISHKLSEEPNKGSLETLWMATIGVTDQLFLNISRA